jgi:hypothetical protein
MIQVASYHSHVCHDPLSFLHNILLNQREPTSSPLQDYRLLSHVYDGRK